MNTTATVVVSVLLAVPLAVATATLLAPESPPPVREGVSEPLLERLAAQEARQAELALGVERVQRALDAQPRGGARVSLEEVDAAVRRYLSEGTDGLGDGPVVEAAAPSEPESVAALAERLLAGDLDYLVREELWQQVRESGRMDEVLAELERRAETDPNDPDLQLDLGVGYLQKIQEVGNGPLAGVYATRADQAFDRALAIDPGHWDARFNKAIALSFWPPVFGKKGEAIKQFELLVERQKTLPMAPSHAQSHLLLGNLYQELGRPADAVAAWRNGLELFPGDVALRAQLELSGQ